MARHGRNAVRRRVTAIKLHKKNINRIKHQLEFVDDAYREELLEKLRIHQHSLNANEEAIARSRGALT